MARTKTLLQLRDRVRTLADVRSVYVNDAALTEEINQSYAELYDKLVAADPSRFEVTQNVSIVSGTSSYAVASNYYKTVGVDVLRSDNTYVTLRKYNMADRNAYEGETGVNREWMTYRIRGDNIVFTPTPGWTQTNGVRHLYIPAPASLSANSDTLDGVAGWEDWVVYDCCIKIVGGKEEGDASQFERLLAKLNERISQMAINRDVGEPDTIRDADAEDSRRTFPRYAPS